MGELVQLRGEARKGAVVSDGASAQERCLQVGQCGAHADQSSSRTHLKRVAEEAVLARDQDFVAVLPHDGRNPLECHHRIERRDLDADDARQRENPVEGGIVVRGPARRLVQIEGDDGQLLRQRRVVGDGIARPRKREQRIGPTSFRLASHLDRVGARDDHFARERSSPAVEHSAPLLGRQVQPATGVRPHGDTGDRLIGHPLCVSTLNVVGQDAPPERNGDGGDQPPFEPTREVYARSPF